GLHHPLQSAGTPNRDRNHLHRCCPWGGMVYPVVQEKASTSIPPTSRPLDFIVKCGVSLTIPDFVALRYQFRVTLTCTPQLLFQPQALFDGFHISITLSLWNSFL